MDNFLTMKSVKFRNIFYSIYPPAGYNEGKGILFQMMIILSTPIYKEEKHEKIERS